MSISLNVLTLEDRTVPANFENVWADAHNISVSFAPDGTDVAGVRSSLHSFLNSQMNEETWKNEIRRAFQSWAEVADLDVRFTHDFGEAFGVASAYQGSLRFGDIRIAARPLSDNVITISNPPDMLSDWAGEIIINTNFRFSKGGGNGSVDLYTALLQESGHALGVPNNNTSDPNSAMFEWYLGARSGLGSFDIVTLQNLYGARQADAFEGNKNNNTTRRATSIEYIDDLQDFQNLANNKTPTVVRADITTRNDVDVYQLTIPTKTSSPTLSLNTSYRSLLTAKVSVLDAKGRVVLTQTASGSGQDISLDLSSLAKNQQYFIRVEAARNDAFTTGGYQLMVGDKWDLMLGWIAAADFSNGNTNLVMSSDTDSTSPISIGGRIKNLTNVWDIVGRSSFSSSSDVDRYQVNSGSSGGTMLVSIWSDSRIIPRLKVTNADGIELAYDILKSDGFNHTIQIQNVRANKAYYIIAEANGSINFFTPGIYQLAVDFRENPIELTTFAQGELNSSQSVAEQLLTVTRSQFFRFDLYAQANGATNQRAVLTVYDQNNQVMFRLSSGHDEATFADVLLAPGTYRVRIELDRNGERSLLPMQIVAHMTALTDPIGPQLLSPLAPTTTGKAVAPTPTPPRAPTSPSPIVESVQYEPIFVEDPFFDYYSSGYFWTPTLFDPLFSGR